MTHIWQGLRSGEWLTPARARAYSLILLALCIIASVGWIAVSDGLSDRNGKPIGTDFSSFYAAGSLALEGRASDAYSIPAHRAREQQIFGAETPYYGWLYPPVFLLVATPLALLPYPLALAVWQGASLALYLAVIAMILRRARRARGAIADSWLPVAVAFPAVFINLGHGQNGFLTAGLLGAALVALPRRPVVAGLLMGLLSYKPQFALVIPFALLAAGQWRAIGAAGFAVIALAGASYLLFGPDCWTAFVASTELSRKVLLEQGDVGFEKLQSAFAAVRMWGGSVTLGYATQAVVSGLAIGSTAWVWHGSADRDLKSALLVAATALASPHLLDYDLVMLAPAMAFFVAARSDACLRDYEISLLAFIWIAPLVARTVAGTTGIPIGLVAMLALFALIMRRVIDERSRPVALVIAQA